MVVWTIYDDCADDSISELWDQPYSGAEAWAFDTDHYKAGAIDETDDFQISRKTPSGVCAGVKATIKVTNLEGDHTRFKLSIGDGISTTSTSIYENGYS